MGGLMCVMGCFAYIDERCGLKAQERLLLKKLHFCLGFWNLYIILQELILMFH